MRILESVKIVISEDEVSDPQEIRYKTKYETNDDTSITEVVSNELSFPVGTTPVSLGLISAGKFVSVKPEADLTLEIDGEPVNLRANKRSFIWADFTAIQIINGGVAAVIASVVIGGD
jgi:hypothetical protein